MDGTAASLPATVKPMVIPADSGGSDQEMAGD